MPSNFTDLICHPSPYANLSHKRIHSRNNTGKIGTTIKVWSSEKKIAILQRYLANRNSKPFFYNAESPTFGFRIAGKFPAATVLSDWDEAKRKEDVVALALPTQWIAATYPKYESILWDRTKRVPRSLDYYRAENFMGYLYANGIIIGDINQPPKNLVLDPRGYQLLDIAPPPTVSIIDHNAYLPVDLARKSLSRPDKELSEAVARSVYMQFFREIILAEFDSASALISWWKSSDFPITGAGWFPFLLTSSGFCLLDRSLLHALQLKKLLVHRLLSMTHLEKQLIDPFCATETGIALRHADNQSYGKSTLLSYMQDSQYSNTLPTWTSNTQAQPAYFVEKYLLYERAVLEDLLTLAKVPNYLKRMIDEGLAFKAGGREFMIVNRSSSPSGKTVTDLVSLCKRTLKNERQPIQDPIIFWETYSGDLQDTTRTSEIWRACFDKILIPYDQKGRIDNLRKDAPIAAR